MKVLKFYSKTCGPCMAMNLNLSRAEIKYEGVDVEDDSSQELMSKYDIKHIPTILVLNDDDSVALKTGFTDVNKLKEIKKEYNL